MTHYIDHKQITKEHFMHKIIPSSLCPTASSQTYTWGATTTGSTDRASDDKKMTFYFRQHSVLFDCSYIFSSVENTSPRTPLRLVIYFRGMRMRPLELLLRLHTYFRGLRTCLLELLFIEDTFFRDLRIRLLELSRTASAASTCLDATSST